MLTIAQSVGKSGVNQIKDLRIIQVALYEAGLLSKTDFSAECIDLSLVDPALDLKEKIALTGSTGATKMHDITDGTGKMAESKIPKTIAAIVKLQKEKLGSTAPDGRIDPNGRTLRKLGELFDDALRARDISPLIFSISVDGEKITLKLQGESREATKVFSAGNCRDYILKHYNWNGIVKLMRMVYEMSGDAYSSPTNLTGTSGDHSLIIPAKGIGHVIRLQVRKAIEDRTPEDANLDLLLRRVDGLPGNGFATKILKARSLADFLSEWGNKSMKKLDDGSPIKVPVLGDSPAMLYDFFREIVRSRNGLWSDEPGISNIVGLRRTVDKMNQTGYNDTLAVCFTEEDENGTIQKRVEINIASTEPGNRVLDRQLVPQTMLLLPGFHNIRQPAGRTSNALKQERNKGSLTWCEGDTTMNFHQGANNFSYPGATSNARNLWLMKYGVDGNLQRGIPKSGWDERTLLDFNLLLSEVFLILSKYGGDGTSAPQQNLEKLAKKSTATVKGTSGGSIKIEMGSGAGAVSKTIQTLAAKTWAVNYWFDRKTKEERHKFTSILQKLEVFDGTTIDNWERIRKEDIIASLTDEHILKVVNTQIEYLDDIAKIDGLPGQTFVELIAGIYPSLLQAKKDKTTLDNLLKNLEGFTLKNVADLQKTLKTSLFIKTENNRRRLYNNTKYDTRLKLDVVENATVGPYSQGCQIIFDTEVFYKFWHKLLFRASQSGQVRWYYTLIDASEWQPGI